MRYTTVLFDADGTLLDFHRSESEAIREAMIKNGIQPTDEKVMLYSEINDGLWKKLERGEIEKRVLLYHRFELLFDALGHKADVKKMSNDYVDALSTKGYPLNGAEQMCAYLYGKARLYIVTNGVERVQRGRYARCGIGRYFEDVFISDVIGVEKPSVKFFDHVFANIDGADKEKTLIVGDSLTSDIKGGINFSIDTCWYNPKNKPNKSDIIPTYTVSNFDGVIKIIMGEDC